MRHSSDVEEAIARVTWWLKAVEADSTHDQEVVHAYWNDRVAPGPIQLRRSDLELLLESAWMYEELRY